MALIPDDKIAEIRDATDIAEAAAPGIDARIRSLLSELSEMLSRASTAEIIRDGVRVVIAGGGDSAVDWALSLAELAQRMTHYTRNFDTVARFGGDTYHAPSSGSVAQTVDVKRGGRLVAAPHDHPAPGPRPVVAGRAEDVEALLPARHHLVGDGERKDGGVCRPVLAGVEEAVLVQLAPRDRVRDEGARGRAVSEEVAGLERRVPGLIVHVLPAGGHRHENGGGTREPARRGSDVGSRRPDCCRLRGSAMVRSPCPSGPVDR